MVRPVGKQRYTKQLLLSSSYYNWFRPFFESPSPDVNYKSIIHSFTIHYEFFERLIFLTHLGSRTCLTNVHSKTNRSNCTETISETQASICKLAHIGACSPRLHKRSFLCFVCLSFLCVFVMFASKASKENISLNNCKDAKKLFGQQLPDR